jgi:hypothetical protein
MHDSHDEDARNLLKEEYDVLLNFKSTQSRGKGNTAPAQSGPLPQQFKVIVKIVDVLQGLVHSPGI